ncbi:MAG: hypothetical protein AB9891_09715 [Anaerolineaceae bacterium]
MKASAPLENLKNEGWKMGFFDRLFGKPPYPSGSKPEVDRLTAELIQIGKGDDFLSEHSGGAFDQNCRHKRAREIGGRLDALGGMRLMEYARDRVRKQLGVNLATHLEYAWDEIGAWVP